MNLENLENMQFGYLKVLYRAKDYISPKGKRYTMWHCKCLNCNKELDIRKSSLKGVIGKRSRSCGCLSTELTNEFLKKENDYDLTSFDFGIMYINNEEITFDLEDYDKIKEHYWHLSNTGYAENSNGLKLHQLIMNDIWIDHIDRNKKNNKKNNLRKCNNSQNMANREKSKNNTSGHKGVKLFKNRDWMACVRKDGKSYCKYFSINKYGNDVAYKMACDAQEKIDLELFGEFSIYYKGDSNE